tara:strand:+ start:1158 stop:1496 length:339 start_codon:yes stop_codon:yes gene_type:complete
MNLINTFILWIWLLGIALVIPITLPAGGAQKSIIEQRETSMMSTLIALKEFNLLAAANDKSSILINVKTGTPFKVMKVWDSPDSGKWLFVSVLNQTYYQLFNKRGWVHFGTL